MPTKITPISKVGGAGGGSTAGGGAGRTGNKSIPKGATGKKSKFFNSHRFGPARIGFSEAARAHGKGYMHSIIFTSVVGIGLLIFGIVLVIVGDDKYIVDVMVLGSLCLVMGAGALGLGFLLILRPAYKERKLQRARKRKEIMAAHAPSSSAQAGSLNPTFTLNEVQGSNRNLQAGNSNPASTMNEPQTNNLNLISSLNERQESNLNLISTLNEPQANNLNLISMLNEPQENNLDLMSALNEPQASNLKDSSTSNQLSVSRLAPGSSNASPEDNDLYDKTSLGATRASLGRLVPPSPPPLSQPLEDRAGTTSTVLTGLEQDDPSDGISEYESDAITAR